MAFNVNLEALCLSEYFNFVLMDNYQQQQAPTRKGAPGNVVNLEKGKLPPQAVEFEEVVLGALLIDKKAVDEAVDILRPEVFYKEAHQEIYRAIHSLFENAEPIDMLTVANYLRKEGKLDMVGGEYYLVNLTNKVSSSAHIEYHSRIILQKYIQRELIRVSSDIIENSYDDSTDVFDLMDKAEASLFDITNGNIKKGVESAQTLVNEAIERVKEISTREGMSGVPSGFRKVDQVTSGWQPSDLVILAARPGMGKTAFVLSMAKNMAIDHEAAVAIFSLEMSGVQLITRMISSETGLSGEQLRKGTLEDHQWEMLYTRVKKLQNAPIYIDDTPGISIFDLRAKCRRLKSQHDIKIIIIDYLQLMTAGGAANGNREQEISTISRNLKAIAKELDVPVIALSQLSRQVETQAGPKRPMLSHLRESGAIEQDADIVSFIYRPEYYGFTEWDDDDQTPCEGQAEFIIAKHRNGSLENIRLQFIGKMALFKDLEEYGQPTTYESSINSGSDDGMGLPNATEVFSADPVPAENAGETRILGSSMNEDPEEDGDIPF